LTPYHNCGTFKLGLNSHRGRMKKQFVAYPGSKFIIEWYFDERGKSVALEYFQALPLERKKKFFSLFRTYAFSESSLWTG